MPAFPATGPARLPVPGPRGVGHVCPERVRPWGPYQGPHNCRSSRLASAGAAAGPAVLIPLSPPLLGVPPEAGPQGLTWPTRLMAQVKQWLAMAAFLASMGHGRGAPPGSCDANTFSVLGDEKSSLSSVWHPCPLSTL